MHFDHDFGTISSIVKIDTTIQPQHGGTINMLDVVGTGGIKLPSGDTTNRIGSTGLVRFNSNINGVEYFDGDKWDVLRDNGSVTVTVIQTAHGFSLMQLLEYDQAQLKYKAVVDLSATAGVVTQIIDDNTFVLTLYGLITGWPTAFDGHVHFWYKDIATNIVTTSSSDASIPTNHTPLIYAAISSTVPIIIPISNNFGADAVGCFIPSSTMFFREYLTYGFESPIPQSPRLLNHIYTTADPTSPSSLARYITIVSASTYTMPSVYLSVSIDLLAISYNSPTDIIMTAVVAKLPHPSGVVGKPSGTPGYLSATGSIDWISPPTGAKQVLGVVDNDNFYYIAPYVEQATPGSVYISNYAPSVTPGIPYLWVQTGLNTDGKGITFWVEDGTI